jgi:CTP:molybdopterin cytidylyltransferase MocA
VTASHESVARTADGLYAVVLAAGASTRFGSAKQLVRVAGRPLLHTAVTRAAEVTGNALIVVLDISVASPAAGASNRSTSRPVTMAVPVVLPPFSRAAPSAPSPSYAADTGARLLLQRNPDRLVRVPMPSAAIDVDTPEDLLALEAPQ